MREISWPAKKSRKLRCWRARKRVDTCWIFPRMPLRKAGSTHHAAKGVGLSTARERLNVRASHIILARKVRLVGIAHSHAYAESRQKDEAVPPWAAGMRCPLDSDHG